MRVMLISIHSSFYASFSIQKILEGSLQAKLKGASIWPFNAYNVYYLQYYFFSCYTLITPTTHDYLHLLSCTPLC